MIDRTTGRAYIFKGGIAIFTGIAEFGKNSKWGDPTNYDLEITRTEASPANFYSVVPDPDSKGVKLTDEEIAESSELDLLLDFTTSKNVKESNQEVVTEEELKDLPF